MTKADELLAQLPPLLPPPPEGVAPDDEMSKLLAEADALADRMPEPERERPNTAIGSSWRPWYMQRMVLRSLALGIAIVFVIVAGRQSGKTEVAVHLTLMIALERPKSYSILLAPNYITAQTAIDKLLERATEIPGMQWHEQKKRFSFPNGSILQVFSADRPEKVGRGPTLDGIFWGDEAAFLSVKARDATLGALTAVRSPLKCFTSTPKGKNWFFNEFTERDPNEKKETFRVRSSDSPYANLEEIKRNRKRMGKEMAAQEYDGVFVDSLLLAFPDAHTMFVEALKPRKLARPGNVIGMDIAKHADWTVFTLMNKFAEGKIIDRFQKTGSEEDEKKFYARLLKRAKRVLDKHNAAASIDTGNNSGPGEALADLLEDDGYTVFRVPTGSPKRAAKLYERMQVGHQRNEIKLEKNEHYDQAVYELGQFMRLQSGKEGGKVDRFQGPQEEGEWDDCVTSIGLAYWGVVELEEGVSSTEGDFTGIAKKAREQQESKPVKKKRFGGYGSVGGGRMSGSSYY